MSSTEGLQNATDYSTAVYMVLNLSRSELCSQKKKWDSELSQNDFTRIIAQLAMFISIVHSISMHFCTGNPKGKSYRTDRL